MSLRLAFVGQLLEIDQYLVKFLDFLAGELIAIAFRVNLRAIH
jgi:hypothetical protein